MSRIGRLNKNDIVRGKIFDDLVEYFGNSVLGMYEGKLRVEIIDDETGKTLNGSTSINAKLQYSSGLENPKIVVALYRRSYDDVYSNKYELVDLADYFTNLMTETDIDNEYL